MRNGYTTGSCAAGAAKGATYLALCKKDRTVDIVTPNGTELSLLLWDCTGKNHSGRCAVKKDSGDDPDVTNGLLVYAEMTLQDSWDGKVEIDGGEGVGRVTLPGLACNVGEAAINPIPRKMIEEAVREAFFECGYKGGGRVTISIPEGREVSKHTYNPKLGIEGGLSILGTSGIVEPMSQQALVDTIKVEMNVQKALGREYLIITPGSYGETFLKKYFAAYWENLYKKTGKNFEQDFEGNPKKTQEKILFSVKCSNFVGESLDYAEEKGFKGILFVGHIGKLSKVAGGIMNTHSSYGDRRMEIIGAHGLSLGASQGLIERIKASVTADNACEEIRKESEKLLNDVMKSLIDKIKFHMIARTHGAMAIDIIMFSNKYGLLGMTEETLEHLPLYFEKICI